jgi:excisionase family DNA binding protein
VDASIDAWPTIPEAVEQTKISQRTLERRIEEGVIRTQKRPVPGRKPLVVLHPNDVADMAQRTLRPQVDNGNLPIRQASPPIRQPDIAAALNALAAPRLALSEKIYLTVKEAAALSGLPVSHIRKQIRQGVIPAKRLAGWRILREDVVAYRLL